MADAARHLRARPRRPGGHRARPAARPRGDRARQGRGHREGHQARQGRRGRHRRRRLRRRRADLPVLHSLAWGIFAARLRRPNYVWLGFLIVGRLPARCSARSPASSRPGSSRAASPPTPDGHRGGPADQGDRADSRPAQPIGAGGRTRLTRARAEASADGRRTLARGDPALDRGQPRRARRSPSRSCATRSPSVTDWRTHLREHQREVMIGAAVAGFVIGGGIAALAGLLTGRRRREYY